MNRLGDILASEIREKGALSIARFMEVALLHPIHGYYVKGDPLGGEGDYVTAPEVSQMFGEIIGLWLVEAWKALGSPMPFCMLELGPGRGTMMQDILRATSKVVGFREAMHLCFFECNATLKRLQAKALPGARIMYLDTIDKLPPLPTLFVGNEFFDVLPVRQFVQCEGSWKERCVELGGLGLKFGEKEVADGVVPEEAYGFYELGEEAQRIMRILTSHIMKYAGAGLVVDYGYVAPMGCNTLQAISKHHRVEPLVAPGEADLTAHVDFAALGRAAMAEGAKIFGPVTQGEFLTSLGIEWRAAQLSHKADARQKTDISSALKRLTGSSEMGYLFKAMGIGSDRISELAGFA